VAGAARRLPARLDHLLLGRQVAGRRFRRNHARPAARTGAPAGRPRARASAAIIDSQSVRAAEEVARSSRGYDAGKKVQGRKRHIAVDVLGLLLTVLVTAASVQDRDAAKPLLWNLRKAFPQVKLARADGGYAGKLVTWAKTALKLTLAIVNPPVTCTPSRSCPVSGWSSAHWPGSRGTVALSATTNGCPPTTRPTSTGQ
jgi:hypothetical protein